MTFRTYFDPVAGELRSAPVTDTTALGTHLYEAGEDLTAFAAISIDTAGMAVYSDLDEAERLLGVSTAGATAGNQIKVRHVGILENPLWSWAPGVPIYALSGGTLSQTADTEVAARIGLAVGSTKMLVRAEPPIFLSP